MHEGHISALLQWSIQCSHHGWCSFEACAEIYNEMIRENIVNCENAANTAKFIKLGSDCETQGKHCLVSWLFIFWIVDCNILPHELSRKIVAEAFWNAEIEAELREKNCIGHRFMSSTSREELMMKIDEERSSSCYAHMECSEGCKSRGMQEINYFVGAEAEAISETFPLSVMPHG